MPKEKTIHICAICGDEIAYVSEYYFDLKTKKTYHLDCYFEQQRNDANNKLPKSKSGCASFRGRGMDFNSTRRS
ncbi:unnamed protein product [marine sediment metagenome]|uniref:PARP-type domain-containing protein n=1 Tax=marine sediment metagenome TaxID=412755 RepID=X1KJ29_9ZZZZ